MVDRCDDPLFGAIPERVLLRDAPLVRVLGQVRFTKIAKIAEESYIANFQEAIRTAYPRFHSDVVQGVELNLNLGGQELQPRVTNSVIWRFLDASKMYRVSLSQDAITLETAKYVSREDFLDRFNFILYCLQETIRPSVVERIGFRYANRLHGEEVLSSLDELVHPELLNVVQPNFAHQIDISMSEVTGTTAEGKLIVRYGLAPADYSYDPDMNPPINERSWVLDVDSYSTACAGSEFDAQTMREALDKVADRAYAFFRWSIKDKFLERFGATQ
ncbi:TIGR04255 family protein [Leisingera sp. NJS204]|uniref:TIGR04255 family protein n=1 Tax=Leisingera sp. NJS204 TaxID=2508307 RepID=UPI001011E168|nr:TIGR04255 family protein [Leisingera sp. NJS204]QAX31322.1 TIGR04255 family protein [Leisingera sp. NJS204]